MKVRLLIIKNVKNDNPVYFYIDFNELPNVGELSLLNDFPNRLFIVVAIANEIYQGKNSPIVIMERWNGKKRNEILKKYGWYGDSGEVMNALEIERLYIET